LFNCCESVSQAVDDALKSATKAHNKTSREADRNVEKAMVALNDYGKKFHSIETFARRRGAAKGAAEAEDKSSSTILNKPPVKEELTVRDGLRVTFAPSHTNTDRVLIPS
jgi:hypothetical protein